MLNKKVAELMVNQVNKELYSSYLYLAIVIKSYTLLIYI